MILAEFSCYLTVCYDPLYRYIFSTEGHLLPSTPQISLVREHCSYFGAYCKNDNIKQEHQASDAASNLQETNDSRFLGNWADVGLPSESSFSDSMHISGYLKVRIAVLLCLTLFF